MPDPELKGNEHREWYDSRAKYRYSIDEILPDGRIRMMCPQCAHDGGAQAPLGSEHAPTAHQKPETALLVPGG